MESSQENDLLLVEVYAAAGQPRFAEGPVDRRAAVRIRGVIVVPDDEVVFYVVSGPSAHEVRRVFEAHGLSSVRITRAKWLVPTDDQSDL